MTPIIGLHVFIQVDVKSEFLYSMLKGDKALMMSFQLEKQVPSMEQWHIQDIFKKNPHSRERNLNVEDLEYG